MDLPSSSNFRNGLFGLFPSELFWNFGSYRQSVGLLGRVISSVARTLPVQDNTNGEETRTDIHATDRFQPRDPSVRAGEDNSCVRTRTTVAGPMDSLS
jgi:hypothetical protein